MSKRNVSKNISLSAVLKDAKKTLERVSDSPLLDAEVLLSHVLKQPRAFLYAHSEKLLSQKQFLVFSKLIADRQKGKPVAYLTGTKEFYGLEFFVNSDVLIPRPDTELLVEEVVKTFAQKTKTVMLDVGTGSGCIVISAVKNLTSKNAGEFFAFGLDISAKAIQCARKNSQRHKTEKHISFLQSDLLKAALKEKNKLAAPLFNTQTIIITANLPYLSETQYRENKNNLRFEPKLALTAKNQGMALYEKLIQQITTLHQKFPDKNIMCFFEIDPSQKNTMEILISKHFPGEEITFLKDLARGARVVKIEINTLIE